MRIAEGLRGVTMICGIVSFFPCGPLAHEMAGQAAGKEVTGRVVAEGLGVPRFSLPVLGAGRPSTTIAINPQSDGSFKVALPLGRNIVGSPTGLPAGFSVKSIMYGSADLSKDPLNIAAADTAELVIILGAPRLGSISGRVTGLKSTEGVRMVLRNNTPGTSWEAPLAADGSFVLTKVNPGTYSLRVSYGGIGTAKQVVLANDDIEDVFQLLFVVTHRLELPLLDQAIFDRL